MFAVPLAAGSWWYVHPAPGSHTAAPSHTLRRASAQEPAPAPDEETVEPATGEQMQRLQEGLGELSSHSPARHAAVYVEDLESGLSAAVNPDRKFVAASLIKLPVMAATYRAWTSHPERRTARARAWMEWMITLSDNSSTDRLIDLVGGPEVVTHLCQDRGWTDLRVRHAILNHRGRRGLNTCTARQITKLLVALDHRRLVSPEADEEMWTVLRRQKHLQRIPAGIPKLPGVEVGNKTGTLGMVLHDAGIVHTPRTRYALTILLDHQNSDAAGDRFCRQVSRFVFNVLHGPVREQENARRLAGPP